MQQISNFPNKQLSKIYLIIILLIFISTLLLVGYFIGSRNNKSNTLVEQKTTISSNEQKPNINPRCLPNITPSNETEIYENVLIYPSPDGSKYFYVYPWEIKSGDVTYTLKCRYSIIVKNGGNYINNILNKYGNNEIPCVLSGFGNTLSSNFIKWINNNEYIIGNKETVKIVNIDNNFKETNFDFDSNKYSFIDVDSSLSYWLLETKKDKSNSFHYEILDKKKNIIMDNIAEYNADDESDYDIIIARYDSINNGFLFGGRKFEKDYATNRFSFLSLPSMTLRIVLTTNPAKVSGRGCIPSTLESQKGTIFLKQGCFIVDPANLDDKNNIIIKL